MASYLRQPWLWGAIGWGGLVTVLSLLPGKTIPDLNIWDLASFDKLGHLIVYAIWTAIWLMAVHRHGPYRLSAGRGVLTMVLYSMALEGLQGAMYLGRNFEIPDIVANIIGALTSYGIFILFRKTT